MNRCSYILIAFILSTSVFCQSPPLSFESITTENGISNNYVRCITQDSLGFIWLGTYNGLNRYDGYELKIFTYDYKDSSSIMDNIIRSLCIDNSNNLWIGTQKGLSRYNREDNSFINYSENNGYNLARLDILNICMDHSGYLWLGTTEEGLIRYNLVNNSFRQYKHDKENPESISNNTVRCIYEDTQHNLWIGTEGGGLNILEKDNDTFRHIYHRNDDPQSLASNKVYSIVEDSRHILWFACSGNGVSTLPVDKIDRQVFTNYRHELSNITISDNAARVLCCDAHGDIWIGMQSLGIDYYNQDTKKFYHYSNNYYDPKSLSDNSVYELFQDKYKNIWIGTNLGGANITHLPYKEFKTFHHIEGDHNSLKSNSVWEFQEDKNGNIWIATDGGGLNQFDPVTGRFISYNTSNSNINTNSVITVFIDSDNEIWIGTWHGGISHFDKKTKSFRAYTELNSALSDNNVFDIDEDHKNNLWIATQNGLNKLDRKSGAIKVYTPENSGILFHQMEVVKSDIYGNILIGNVLGFEIFNPTTEVFINFAHDPGNEESLSNNFITSIFEEDSSTIWISTTDGLNRLNRKTNKITRYYKNDGLPSDLILGIEKDNNGYLWISTNNGLSRFDENLQSFVNFFKEDGLQDNTFIKKSHLKSKDGTMYFGGTNGFNMFRPEQIVIDSIIPNIVITDLFISSKPAGIAGDQTPLDKDISLTKIIKLTHKQPVFSLRYALLEYRYPERVNYSYILEGFEKEWNEVGSLRTATYTNLDPGDYVFKVKGYRKDNRWITNTTSLKIEILPPWWETLLFKISLIVITVLIIILIYRFRVDQLKRQKQFLEAEVDKRTAELSEVNKSLIEKQKEISEANVLLEENQDEILAQNEELEKHRNHLEQLVRERTAELEYSKIKAEESDRLKSAFLANMSHEIRTPMNAIVGFASLLNSQTLTKDEKNEYITVLNDNCEILSVLIDDIIDISLIESNQVQIIKSPFQVNPLLEQLLEYFKLKNTKDIVLTFENKSDKTNLVLNNDHIRFRQIFSNLISNALKYTEKGFIKFGYLLENDLVKFYVSDSGIGIAKTEYNRIFDHFQKVERPDIKIYRGIGIGLSICKRLVELMGGLIWIESEPNKGSNFYFTLPYDRFMMPDQLKSSVSDRPADLELSNKKILIAEDEPANFLLLRKILEPTNAEIIWAKNGQEAIEAIDTIKDIENVIILMDIKMPVMNGIDAFKKIRAKHSHIPIIAITAYAHESEKAEILKNNFNGYIVKPIRPNMLVRLIKQSIEKPL